MVILWTVFGAINFSQNIYDLCMCLELEGLHVKKRRGRKAKSLLQHRGTVLKGITSPSATSIVSTSNAMMGGAGQGVICSTQPATDHQQPLSTMDKKQRRSMLLMKAKADKARKRAEVSDMPCGIKCISGNNIVYILQ